MSDSWTPDESLGSEAYESWDEDLDEEDALDPGRPGNPEGERSLDWQLVEDRREAAELGTELDDPERMVVLDGGMDDPDGIDPVLALRPDDDGWDLDATGRSAFEEPEEDDR
jgi:hypothetical protein